MRSLVHYGVLVAAFFALAACSGGGGETEVPDDAPRASAAVMDAPTPAEASRFLVSATFGPTQADIDHLTRIGYSAWFREQFALPSTTIASTLPLDAEYNDTLDGWWTSAVYGRDQLRQRAAFALSQIFVISAEGSLFNRGQAMAAYMDILQRGAFAHYEELLTDITYSPAMGIYLTYIGNRKASPDGRSVPDENYAREILQLFSIGLVELNPDGSPRLDQQGRSIETFDNMDVTELAKVFTGLWWAEREFRRDQNDVTPLVELQPMVMSEADHASEQKQFLDLTIPAGASGEESIALTMAHLADHPNTAPFISRQLIQRFVTSNPSPAYVARVAAAFDAGIYVLPDGGPVGDGQRGDMRAVLAAILLDEEALDLDNRADPQFGKLREPVVMFAHWARVFRTNSADGSQWRTTRQLYRPDRLNQQPYRAPSVFNFYRPGYVAPGSQTAAAGLVAPELQITHSNSIVGFVNFMDTLVRRTPDNVGDAPVFIPDYSRETPIASDPEALVDRLDLVLTSNRMRPSTRQRILDAMAFVDASDPDVLATRRVQIAVLMTVTSPEFMVQF